MLSAYLAAEHGGRSETSVVAFPPPWRHSTYYGALLTMALYLLWRSTYYGALLTMALYLLWRSTYYGSILTMAYFIVAATSSPPAELRSTTPHTTVESKP